MSKVEKVSPQESRDRKLILEHPEVQEVLLVVLTSLAQESDRGAVLIGAEIVDAHLADFFRRSAPATVEPKHMRRLLEYPGQLSSLAAKADIGLGVGLLNRLEYNSITALRKIRNKAAHSKTDFKLEDHPDHLRQIYDLGPDVPRAVVDMSSRVLAEDLFRRAKVADAERVELGNEPLFQSDEDVHDFLRESDNLMSSVREKQPRLWLGFGVALICGLITYHRESRESSKPD